ncbi:type II secretion system F family protein [Luteipulveratus halotolerans]|uniref:Type II secretion system protein GspF domain-containing protein n=1 Tax=Luteipulveratus halotolerans TaxID=1631356 RepID=A0A0L6CEK9_9MICO|nr:type II secretion system F family protein [Luteipulveratus halotolerans]KNX36119.1 hypothetical protein VV01_01480 [Luteipulveratus halotolerans]
MTVLVVGLLVGLAVMTWPHRRAVLPGAEVEPITPPVRRPRRRRASRADRERSRTVLRLLDSVAPAVEAGVPPAQAVEVAVRTTRIHDAALRSDVDQLVEAGAQGHDLGPLWLRMAERHHSDAIGEVGRAWTLSDRFGSPLADALATATATMRARIEHERKVHTLIAGPRATMQLLTLLPVGGLGLAPIIGVPLSEVYSARVLVLAGVPGIALLLIGRYAVARMVRRATAQQALT